MHIRRGKKAFGTFVNNLPAGTQRRFYTMSKLGKKLLLVGTLIGSCAAAYTIYKKKCDDFEKTLEDDFDDEEEDEEDERSYTNISLDDEEEKEEA